ncbi:MAG: multidrug effflux MFS transporter [Xanthomonadales bacterium]|nr:multidrug effflux MFS transporter [Xanthomonadales bacterium]
MSDAARAPLPIGLLTVLVGALGMVGPFAIDSFFPAFPTMAHALDASSAEMQLTLSAYLFGFALMSLVHGPLSDAIGRRPIVLVNLAIFTLANIGAALSTSLEEMVLWRLLQGLAGGAGTIVGRAIVRDCLEGAAAQRLMSRITLVFLIGPAVAPVVGGWIYVQFGWQAIFWFVAGFAGLLALVIGWKLPETLPPEQRVPPRIGELLDGLLEVARDRVAVRLIMAAACNFAGIFLFIGAAAEVSYQLLRLAPEQFGRYFWMLISGFLIGSQLSGWLAGKISAGAQLKLAYVLMGSAVLLNLLQGAVVEQHQWWLYTLPLALYAVGSSLGFPVLTLLLLDRFDRLRGSAASLQTFVSLLLNALSTALLVPLVFHSALLLALAQAALALLGALHSYRYLRYS